MKYFWFYVILCIFVILLSTTIVANRSTEKFESYTRVPLKVHIMRNMDIYHSNTETSTDTSMNSFITVENAKTIIDNVNTHFFRKHGIEWVAENDDFIEVPLKTDQGLETLSKIERPVISSDYDTSQASAILKQDSENRDTLYKKIINNTDRRPMSGVTNLYFFTFTGNTRQGKYVTNGDTPLVVVGQWSNKNQERLLGMRPIMENEGTPSLTFTVAHELSHVLGLSHLGTNEENIMNAETSSFKANLDQEIIMTRMAKKLSKKYEVDSLDNPYHESEEIIRENEKHKMNVFYVRGEDGKPVGINMERTQTFPTFYTPGTFTYSASNYVPSYEDFIKLARVDISRNYGYEYDMIKMNNGGLYTFVREEDDLPIRTQNYDVNRIEKYHD